MLALILVAGLALRLWNIDYGLPFVYSIDEGSHFTSRAVEMFWQDLDPGYYQNPSAYTYLIYVLFRVMYGPLGFLFDLPFGNVTDQFDKNPTEMWIAARALAAVLCTAGVAATYWAARRLWGVREGLVAAALLAFAFLPVAYSRVAVTDVGALLGVSLALGFAVWAYEDGRMRFFAAAGAAAGLALSFKYTAGLALVPVLIAALARLRDDPLRALGGLALGTALAGLVFVALNPYVFGSLDSWWSDLRDQAEVAADQPKPGQESGGVSYYLDSLTWGLGWAAAIAALLGAVLELRRNLVRGLMLVAVPVALFVYLSLQSRYFGRWLLPAYPALAMLAAAALTQLTSLVPNPSWRGPHPRRSGAPGPRFNHWLPTSAARRCSGATTRASRRATGSSRATRPSCAWPSSPRCPGAGSARTPRATHRAGSAGANSAAAGPSRAGPTWPTAASASAPNTSPASWHARTVACARPPITPCSGPEVIDDYRLYGYCLVMTVDVVRDRALQTGDAGARAYYERIEDESRLVREFSPYDEGADPVPFNFDLSYNYYPPEYHRPGPTVRVYRLDDCEQASGPPVIRIPQAREPAPVF